MIPRPEASEYGEYYGRYIERVPDGAHVLALLAGQSAELQSLLQHVSDEQANARPAPGEWSIKEVIGHVCDVERIFAYRAVSIARGDTTPLPGFEQDDYVAGTDFNVRSLGDLVEEFSLQRRANLLCFRSLTDVELARQGTASGFPASVRALVFILAGHVMHHVESLQTSYKVDSR